MENKTPPQTCRCSVSIRGLTVKKHDGLILDHIDLDVRHGEILALIGRNGAGKTTLLKALLGRCPYTGEIIHHNHRGPGRRSADGGRRHGDGGFGDGHHRR